MKSYIILKLNYLYYFYLKVYIDSMKSALILGLLVRMDLSLAEFFLKKKYKVHAVKENHHPIIQIE